jgi:hypothetical protein
MSISLYRGTVTLTVEAALSAATGSYGAWDSGIWDTSTWGPDVVWTDVSGYARQASTNRSFGRDVMTWESGSARVVLDNRDGRFSPANLSGPYVTSGVTQVRPWRPLRIRATYGSTTYDVYNGYALAWEESYQVQRTGKGDSITTVPCTDELARLAGFDGLEQPAVGGEESAGRRIHRVLDNAGHTGTRSVDEGRNSMQATTLAQNAVTELKLTTDSEGGALFVDGDGTVTFENQFALIENSRSNSIQATFGDGGGSELPYAEIEVHYDGDLVKNIASFARVGGTAQTSSDNTSRALYGDRRESRTDLVCESDAQALGLAQWWVARYKDPELRVTKITIKPRRDPANLFPQALGRRVRDLIRVVRRPAGGHTITRDCFIAGISHTITPEDWTTEFELWSATAYTAFSTSRWDTGVFDTATWFF